MKELSLTQVLALPIKIAKELNAKQLTASEIDKILSELDILDEYKGPFTSDVAAKHKFCDTVKVDHYNEAQQPDGTWLITLNTAILPDSNIGVYIRVHTNSSKKALKYAACAKKGSVTLKGDLDLYVCGPILFTTEENELKNITLAVAITVIDFL